MNVLISSCFMLSTRYDGKSQNKPKMQEIIDFLLVNNVNIIPVCPEQLGGLTTPRPPAEIIANRVVDINGTDVTYQFERGANLTLETIQKLNIQVAILKQGSPSCGSKIIYDGSHSGKKIAGQGVTTKLLLENGVAVYSEDDLQLIKDKVWKSRI